MTKKTIGTRDAMSAMRGIIDRCPIGGHLDAADVAAVNALTGWFCVAYRHDINPAFPTSTRCLWVSEDGNRFDVWSWRKAIEGNRNRRKDLMAAMRYAIHPQTREYLAGQVAPVCAHCGKDSELTVDHSAPSFVNLVAAHYDDITLENQGPGGGWRIADPQQVEMWQRFHKEHARYQVLCRGCNARKG
jgi:hypothetical protein